ncbi:hypothetical protein Poli38472_000129 [Pythium oligandrum]|uniref:FAM86 N-terminal domain-containing protein n=1 Tax=Pythium oligandrum TaxID=41045 RepID=A0A8K1CD26_PYTOL|nr:hypothetical protein Poli38472_000129 [Pythium oligandrum]|eukprot:TMW60087.1 hypothetical protein Poli38472_000129 [Pythium oligandrum]
MKRMTTRNWQEELTWLVDAYRAVLPIKELLSRIQTQYADGQVWTTLEFQDAVIDVVVHDAIVQKYAPPRSYTYRFLKQYTDAIERVMAELSDALVAELMEFVAVGRMTDRSAVDSEEMHHVTYRVPRQVARTETDITVTCRVASVFNEVGLKIWEAGWFLAEYIFAHPEQFEDRTVLELGAGVGFTGIALAKCVRTKKLILSDYAPRVMLNLRYNVEINAADLYLSPVDIDTVDWETWDPQHDSVESQPDILLAGDCVYDVAVFPYLVRVLQVFLGSETEQDGSQPRRVGIFAATIRNQATFQTFLDTLKQYRIEYEDITVESTKKMSDTPLFPYENREQFRLCKLYRSIQASSQ